jgi:hypothetical protein
VVTSLANAQVRPSIGYVYPAGGKQGTTFAIRLGGQGLDNVHAVLISGAGVTARVVEYRRRLNPQEVQLLREQVRELKDAGSSTSPGESTAAHSTGHGAEEKARLIARMAGRIAEFVPVPASASISNIVLAEVTLAADAQPGPRELRLVTPRGATNPLPFHVGQLAENARKPMATSRLHVLGKEELSLRKRPEDEVEERITLPCTVNGQIASGEMNRYRFTAQKGQHLVLYTAARQLIPYIADAVPGWFQPVLTLYDSAGKEVAYDDDDRFHPDPVILFNVSRDGEYSFAIADALYRGREDFVYRVTIGEIPFVTSIFPLGGRAGTQPAMRTSGWNLEGAALVRPASDAGPGIYWLNACKDGIVSNRVPFVLDTLPEALEREPNDKTSAPQLVNLPIIINGRIDHQDDVDVFRFQGRAGETVVAEIIARRLDSSLDSLIKLTGADGRLLAFNDDHDDPASGLNTHHADSYILATLPANGTYHVIVSDVARGGGEGYAYRLRVSSPQPDFELRAVPSSVTLRSKAVAPLTVHVIRKDGFAGPIKLTLKDPPERFTAPAVTVPGNKDVAVFRIRTTLTATKEPIQLKLQGAARIQGRDMIRLAVPAEDRMQAFLWRHLVPALDLKAAVFDPTSKPPPGRVSLLRSTSPLAAVSSAAAMPKFTKQQVAGRLRQLKLLFDEGLLTDEFYARKVAECEAVQ